MVTRTLATVVSAFARTFLNLTPHPTQQEFLDCAAQTIVVCAGRRWGKTRAAAAIVLHFAFTHPGSKQLIIAPTLDQARILFNEVRGIAEQGLLHPLIEVIETPYPEIRMKTRDGQTVVESVITIRSAGNGGKYLRGHGADQIVIDEAGFLPDTVVREVIEPMLATSPHRRLILISTPFGKNHFYEDFLRGQTGDPNIRSFQFPTSCNPHVSPEFLQQQQNEQTDLRFRTEFLAQFIDDQDSVFRHELIARAIDPDMEMGAVMPGDTYVIGYDPAKWSDRSAVIVLNTTRAPHSVVEIRDIAGRAYTAQEKIVADLARRYNNASVLLDGTANDLMLEQLVHQGIRAEAYKFTNPSKQTLIEGLVTALEQGDLRIPHHLDLIRELQYYRYQLTPSGNVRLGAPDRAGMHDDLVTALALAVHKGRNWLYEGQFPSDFEREYAYKKGISERLASGQYGLFDLLALCGQNPFFRSDDDDLPYAGGSSYGDDLPY